MTTNEQQAHIDTAPKCNTCYDTGYIHSSPEVPEHYEPCRCGQAYDHPEDRCECGRCWSIYMAREPVVLLSDEPVLF